MRLLLAVGLLCCATAFAPARAGEDLPGGWRLEARKDPITDRESLLAIYMPKGLAPRALLFGCHARGRGELSVGYHADARLGGDASELREVQYRFDGGQVEIQRWAHGETLATQSDPVLANAFAERLLTAKQVVVRVTDASDDFDTGVFPISGAAEPLNRVRTFCGAPKRSS